MTWAPQSGPQADAIAATWADEMLYGGAKFGGKSDFLLGDYLQDVQKFGRHWQGILFRKKLTDLQDLIRRSFAVYKPTGADWHEQKKEWHWSNGASLRMRYLERVRDAENYQGHSYSWIGIDEIGQWENEDAYKIIRTNLRWAEAEIPTKRVRCSANPGGPGHTWIKRYFIDHAPLGYTPIFNDLVKMWRVYIPARVRDNQQGLRNDPGYMDRLRDSGPPELVKAWLEGDWNIITGAYFPEFGARHVINPFTIPKHWQRYHGFDWGYHSPFCGLWGAISSGRDDNGHELPYPKGAIVIYRECTGKGWDNDEIATKFKMLSEGEDLRAVADPSIFSSQGGPSIADQFTRAGFHFRPADNDRISGWNEIRRRLKPDPAYLYISTACPYLLETLPALPMDEKNPEDADTTAPDHAADALRYLCKERILQTDYKKPEESDRMGSVRIARYIADKRKERDRPRI